MLSLSAAAVRLIFAPRVKPLFLLLYAPKTSSDSVAIESLTRTIRYITALQRHLNLLVGGETPLAYFLRLLTSSCFWGTLGLLQPKFY